jgi:hypothetical protein
MGLNTALLFLASLCGLSSVQTTITPQALQTHVALLSSELLEGRLTGSFGETLATQYAAFVFQYAGLEPAGDNGTFFQAFNFAGDAALGKKNQLLLIDKQGLTRKLTLGKEWLPISGSANQSFHSSELIWLKYGITARSFGKLPSYDSYKGLNVKNKWVVVFQSLPKKLSIERQQQLSAYASLRYRIFTAKTHGAKGIIFINDGHATDQMSFTNNSSLSNLGIIAITLKSNVFNDLLKSQTSDRINLSGISIKGNIDIVQKQRRARNVLAKLKLNSSSNQMLLVSAHIDHLGYGKVDSGTRESEYGLLHYGADDNASGVAAILEMAMKFSKLKTQHAIHGDKDIIFALWSGEELGLLGSTYFVKKVKPAKILANINIDMIGRLRNKLILQGVGSSLAWPKLIESADIKHIVPIILQADPYLPTDSTSFYLHGIPTLNFFTGAHDEYHTSRDKPETLNYIGMKKICDFLVELILTLEKPSVALAYHRTSANMSQTEQNLVVYLGTIPDYTSPSILGVKLSGITKASPAEKAGMRPGDIIQELAGKKIHNIYDYTFVLNSLTIGKPNLLRVLRDKTILNLTIVPKARSEIL